MSILGLATTAFADPPRRYDSRSENEFRCMAISVFDLFSIGIGPSSSHTVGPMLAAKQFRDLLRHGPEVSIERLQVELFGSLSATGRGHGTDQAVLGGLLGFEPRSCEPSELRVQVASLRESKQLEVQPGHSIEFDEKRDLNFSPKTLPFHANGLRFTAYSEDRRLLNKTYYSIGGGFVVQENEQGESQIIPDSTSLPFYFTTGEELMRLCESSGQSVSGLMLRNELQWRDEWTIRSGLNEIWQVMERCIQQGCETEGILPGGMKVKRRAAGLYRRLLSEGPKSDPMQQLDWVNLWAMAVNEENAAGGKVVTAPTNGAAGIIPAVLKYVLQYSFAEANEETRQNVVQRFLLAGAAIGIIFKENASISGAEVGCQGEVGSACSMAAGALTEVLGGTPQQVENAAEIGMEHNLGLTCDPVGGLVQVPCIERNAMASVKAINASRLALRGDGYHFVSLDKVVKTMRETGRDMQTKYKETARGGLAVNVIEC